MATNKDGTEMAVLGVKGLNGLSEVKATTQDNPTAQEKHTAPKSSEEEGQKESRFRFITRLRRGCNEVTSCCRDVKDRAMSLSCRSCVRNTCTLANVKKKLPILKWLPKYRCPDFAGDVIAGLTVGLTVIPQGLAYAQVANLGPQYGLYSAFMGCFVYCILGTSKDITLGPTAIMSLMTAEFAHGDPVVAIVLTFMCGLVQVFMGLFYLGFMVDFIPYPVINSFTVAAAITIACGQIKKWLGISVASRSFIPQLYWTFARIKETKIWDFVLGLICMILLYVMKRIKNMKWREDSEMSRGMRCWKQFVWILTTARNAVVVLIASGVAFGTYDLDVFSLTPNITAGIPPFSPPKFDGYVDQHNHTVSGIGILEKIGGGLAIVPLMGVVESIAIGNAFARRNGYTIDANQELVAIGAANLVGSFVGSYPVTGSFSRTAVNSQSGVRTPGGGVWTGLLILLALGVLTPYFQYIPSAALAGVIIMAVLDMVSFQIAIKLWKIKKLDLLPWLVCFFLSLGLGIEWGIIGGVGFAMLLLLYPWARPAVKAIKDLPPSSQYSIQDITEREVSVIQMSQGLLYPGVEFVRDRVLHVANRDGGTTKSVVLDCLHLSNIDYSAIQCFQMLTLDFEGNHAKFILANVQPKVLEVLQRANITKLRYCNSVDEAIHTILDECDQEDNPRQALLSKSTSPEATTSTQPPPQTSSYGTTTPTSNASRSPTSQRQVDVTTIQPGINDDVVVKVDGSHSEEA